MKKYYSTLVLLFFAEIISAQFTWIAKDTFPGLPRRMAAGLAINGMGYVIGGNTDLSPFTAADDVWQYNPSTDVWTQKSNFPYGTVSPAFFTINNTGYIVGGENSAGSNLSNTYAYDDANDSWTPKANFPGNGVSGAFQFVVNGLAFVGSGARLGSNTSNTMYSYNPTTDTWAQAANFPGSSIVSGVAFAIDSFGYAGSGTDGSGNYFNQVFKYNPGNNSWTPVAPFPGKARNGAISFVLDGKAYVGGGVSLTGTNYYSLGDFYQYDPTTNIWSAVAGFPGGPRQAAAPFVINNIGYAVTGLNDDGNIFYNTVSEFGTCSGISGILPVQGGNTKSGIEIYPNPSTNDVNVRIGNEITSEIKYEVVSIDGKLIRSGTTRQNTFRFSADNLSQGLYIITLTDNHGLQAEQRFEVIH